MLSQSLSTPVAACESLDVLALRAAFPLLLNNPDLVYFDTAATALKPACVIDAELAYYTRFGANVHRGSYGLAQQASAAFEQARASVASFLGASASEVVFVRGATEAINLLANSFGSLLAAGDEIVVSALEHHANLLPWQQLASRSGVILRVLPLDGDGQVDLIRAADVIGPRCRLLALTEMANATGVIPPWHELAVLARAQGAAVLLDGAQGVVHGKPGWAAVAPDFYVFSGHKVFGPTGVGVLVARGDWLDRLPPWQVGGEMVDVARQYDCDFASGVRRFEAGTPAIAQAIGLGAALDWLAALPAAAVLAHEQALRARLEAGLQRLPAVRILAQRADRGPLCSLVFEGVHAGDVALLLGEREIAVRAGLHCAHPLLANMGVAGSLRVSLAPYNTVAEVDLFLQALTEALALLDGE